MSNDVQAVRSRVSASLRTGANPWPWRKHRTAQEWLEFYLDNEDLIDEKAERTQKRWTAQAAGEEAGPSQPRLATKPLSSQRRTKATTRTPFEQDDDYNLMQFLAIEYPEPKGRKSSKTYNRLVANVRVVVILLLTSDISDSTSRLRTDGHGQIVTQQRPGEKGTRRGTIGSTPGSYDTK